MITGMYWICIDNEGFEDQLVKGRLYRANLATNSISINGRWYGISKFRPTFVNV